VASSPKAEVRVEVGHASGDRVELPTLLAALRASGGNVARAAAMLGITRQRAYRAMESHAVDLDAIRGQEVSHK
jgi:transcriptional regulator of acetoin/glycerol metabolism